MGFLRLLGARIRGRRTHLGLTRVVVARNCELSVSWLAAYEFGQGHPPAATLHRIAMALGTTSSALLGETNNENAEQVDEMMRIFAHPQIGAVIGYMQDMTPANRSVLQGLAQSLAARKPAPETVKVMT